ncbi:MAG: ABC transporter permease [Thermoplasmata archaeon]|jgi:ABC-2 type transport system permease protein
MDRASLPSDVAQWITAVRRQLRFYLKTWRFVGLLLFILIVDVAITAVGIAYNMSGTSASDYLYGAIGAMPTLGVIVGAFIGGDAIAMDFGSGTGFFMLVLPVRRTVLLLGRYAAAFLASFALILVFFAISLFGAAWFYGLGAIPWIDVAASLGIAALFAMAVLATAFLFSSFFRSPAVSMVVTILVLFLALDIIDGVISITSVEPWFSILYAGQAVALVFESQPHLTVTHGMGVRGITFHSWTPYVWEGVVVMLAYFVIALSVSVAIYHYKELKG